MTNVTVKQGFYFLKQEKISERYFTSKKDLTNMKFFKKDSIQEYDGLLLAS